ncbi:MAG: cupin domain-containing protein [Iphinoe sp. HA4291-MV1]|jgi:anti-sigma factor ChrR (cupin superfamily)|nr:cupin domain-containing protein [Iphinoe sp. HA4291-MV1]
MVYQQFQATTWEPIQINCNLSRRVAVDSAEIIWQQTPFEGIWFGCFEADSSVQDHPLTMLTRFDPGGFFPKHGHPDGEEILVLQGTFADETGEYPPGSYLLNPESFIHLPFSSEGCMTFVKLRQHGGDNRKQIRTNINDLPWLLSSIPQIEVKPLYEQEGFSEKVRIERWQPETALQQLMESQVKEIFVLEGVWADEMGEYQAGTWLRYPPHCPYIPSSPKGCVLYVKTYPLPEVRFHLKIGAVA